MGEAQRKELELHTNRVARKTITGFASDVERRVVVIQARGPLDTTNVETELHYAQLKALAAQLIGQEAELERAALAAGVLATPT